MKICITAQEPSPDSPIDPRFGRAAHFVVYDSEAKSWGIIDNKQNLQAAQGAGIQAAATVVNAGCGVLITGHCGPKAFAALSKAGVTAYTVSGVNAKEAVEQFKQGTLTKLQTADVEGHW
ncbi:MAG: dinitrogenase iron-molybdenum cofactor biosynthesis protein [Chitinivibrionales bacterium]|nr:dinitrogenase iron-molybdenum cofactor biosynthesis protein [Chitinivibrionales bacterium]MBD3358486.1 dinitrogenase iron-molybdenum cofactor biosynthesis protein [Chitinivibrionales bacterium]